MVRVRPGEFVGLEPCSITLWMLIRVSERQEKQAKQQNARRSCMGVRPGELVGLEPCSITLWLLVRVRPAPPPSRAFWRLLRSGAGGEPLPRPGFSTATSGV